MIKEKELRELTIEDLMKMTWDCSKDYSKYDIIGLYEGKIVEGFLFDVKECGGINPLMIQKCNVVEGWIEYFECKGTPSQPDLRGLSELDFIVEEGKIKRERLNCNVVVDVLDNQGKVIVSLGKKD